MYSGSTGKHVLLIEDNADDERIAVAALRSLAAPVQITVAHDGKEAIDLLFSNSKAIKLPDLILLDIKLPKHDGLELLELIRKDPGTEGVPVVMLTSSDMKTDISQSYRLGANSYIQKSIDPSKYSEEVRLAGLYWTSINIGGKRSQ